MARAIYIRCIYGIFGRKTTKYVIYGVYIRFWPTLLILLFVLLCVLQQRRVEDFVYHRQ